MRWRQFSCYFYQANINLSAQANRRETCHSACHAAGANVFYQAVWSYPDMAASTGGAQLEKRPKAGRNKRMRQAQYKVGHGRWGLRLCCC